LTTLRRQYEQSQSLVAALVQAQARQEADVEAIRSDVQTTRGELGALRTKDYTVEIHNKIDDTSRRTPPDVCQR
jgi:hypothetical protein